MRKTWWGKTKGIYEIYVYIHNNNIPPIFIIKWPSICSLFIPLYSHPPTNPRSIRPMNFRLCPSSHRGRLRWPNTVVPSLVATAASEGDGVESSETLGLVGVEHALGGLGRVPSPVIAVRVLHVLFPKGGHFRSLLVCDSGGDGWIFLWLVALGEIDGVHGAPVEDEVGEFGYVRGIFVTHFVLSSVSGPIGAVPYCCIQRHRFRGEVSTHGFCPLDLSNRNIIHVKAAIETNRNINKEWG